MTRALPSLSIACLLWACGSEPEPPPSLFTNDGEGAAKQANGPALWFEPAPDFPEIEHHADRTAEKLLPETIGGGVALVDLDRNGAVDIVFIDGGHLEGTGGAAEHHVLLNDGKGSFTDKTAEWGLVADGYGMGVAAGDVDGDGWTDLFLTSYGGADRLLRNVEGKRFEDVTATWGVLRDGWSTSAAFLDADEDGDLDLYVARYVDYTRSNALKCWFKTVHIYCTPAMYEALPDRLYRNDGGRFTEVAAESGLGGYDGKGLAVGTGDLDGDGHVDLYVANDITRNLMFMGKGDGTFEEAGILAGVAYSEMGSEEASMGVSVADADEDGSWDMAVTNFQAEPTSIYFRQRGAYRERSDAVGVGLGSRARLSFGVEWLDADNDCDSDLLMANGHISNNVDEYREGVVANQPNSLFLNERGDFLDVSDNAGPALAVGNTSRGLAVGDLDGDGGVDYVVANSGGPLEVALNRSEARGHWLNLWLEGAAPSNRSAIGAVVTATLGDRTVVREVRGGSSFLSVSDRRLHFGLGQATAVDRVEIRWPDGSTQQVEGLEADRHLHWVQGQAPVAYQPGSGVIAP